MITQAINPEGNLDDMKVKGIWGTIFTRKQLENAFYKVQNLSDWKAPIDTTIQLKDYELCASAVEFYSATPLTIVKLKSFKGDVTLQVAAIGYRSGPAGDH